MAHRAPPGPPAGPGTHGVPGPFSGYGGAAVETDDIQANGRWATC